MMNSHIIDYADVLSDLKAKRKELDKAIASIEALTGGRLLAPRPDPEEGETYNGVSVINPAIVDLRGKGAYEATIGLLKIMNKPLKTVTIFSLLQKHGVISKESKRETLAATLYKAVDKENALIMKVGKGEWTLKA